MATLCPALCGDLVLPCAADLVQPPCAIHWRTSPHQEWTRYKKLYENIYKLTFPWFELYENTYKLTFSYVFYCVLQNKFQRMQVHVSETNAFLPTGPLKTLPKKIMVTIIFWTYFFKPEPSKRDVENHCCKTGLGSQIPLLPCADLVRTLCAPTLFQPALGKHVLKCIHRLINKQSRTIISPQALYLNVYSVNWCYILTNNIGYRLHGSSCQRRSQKRRTIIPITW